MKGPRINREPTIGATGSQTRYPPFIEALQNPRCYPHPVATVRILETHISWVMLTGCYAYKVKKPVNFGFLDFSSLESRAHYCREEVRLNRRYAPELYLEVVSICGTISEPHINGAGPA